MGVEQHLFHRVRPGVAILGGLHQRGGQGIGLVDVLQRIDVGRGLSAADHRVEHRGEQQANDRAERGHDRQADRIVERRPAAHHRRGTGEQAVDHEQGQDRQGGDDTQLPPDMAQLVMPRLVPGHGADLGQRGLLQRHVGNGDARGRADARDIGGEAVGLARAIVHEDAIMRDADIIGDLLQRHPHRSGRNRLVMVEQRLDHRRAGQQHHRRGRRGEQPAPHPPAPPGAPHQGINAQQEQRAQDSADQRGQGHLAQIVTQRLAGHPVGPLARPVGPDRPRQADHRVGDQERETDGQGPQCPAAAGQSRGDPVEQAAAHDQP